MLQQFSRTTRLFNKTAYMRQYSVQCLKHRNELLTYWKRNKSFFVCGSRIHRQFSTEPNIISSSYEKFVVPNCTISDYVWKDLDKWEDKTAVVCGITGKGYTYGQAYRMSVAFAACLRNQLDMDNGDCIAIMLPNSPEYPIATLGGLQAGCFVTTINPIYTEEEVLRQLQDSNAKVVVTSAVNFTKVKKAINSLRRTIPIIVADCDTNDTVPEGAIRFAEFAENFSESTECLKKVRRTGDDVAFLPYSSGTTGLPKGVQLTHKNITSNCLQSHLIKYPLTQPATSTRQDITIGILPFFHIYGLVVVMLSKLAHGVKLVTLPKFTPETFLKAQEKHQSTVLYVVPPLVLFLTHSKDVTDVHLQSLKSVTSGAAPLAGSDVERFLEKSKGKVAFIQGYGLTEASPMCFLQEQGDRNYGSIGRLVANCDAVISDLDNFKPLGPNQTGEIWVRGPNIMKGYHNNPEASAEVFGPDGWMKTGDMAYYDKDHCFFITDRIKELIKVKGFQVPPAELEGILRSHPDLEDAAVIGVPHPKYGEVPKAFVVKKKNASPSGEAIKSFVAEKVASYKKIVELQFIDSIPKTASGKILRRELKLLK